MTPEFQFVECNNLYIAPPAAFFPHECDANPTLKSVTVAQYAMDDILRRLAGVKKTVPVLSSDTIDVPNRDREFDHSLLRILTPAAGSNRPHPSFPRSLDHDRHPESPRASRRWDGGCRRQTAPDVKATTARLPGHLSLRQAIEQLQREMPKDAHAARVLQQLAREMTEVHNFLAVRPTGIEKVDPQTTLDQIAVPQEIRTHEGIEVVPRRSLRGAVVCQSWHIAG